MNSLGRPPEQLSARVEDLQNLPVRRPPMGHGLSSPLTHSDSMPVPGADEEHVAFGQEYLE